MILYNHRKAERGSVKWLSNKSNASKVSKSLRLLGDISSAGDRIARSRNLRDMAKFKMLVRRFLKEAVESGMGLKQSHTWNRFGEGRRLKIVETIDERLIELAEDLLNEEKTSIDLLAKIGEIKGLLINLYM